MAKGKGRGREFFFEILIRATPRQVWRALVDPKRIPKWSYPVRARLDRLAIGGTFTFACEEGPDDSAEILDLKPEKVLVYRWSSSEPEPTVVAYFLIREGRYTKLIFANYGFGHTKEWDRAYEQDFLGWVEIHLKLKRHLEGTRAR